jgi:hypothetical protein
MISTNLISDTQFERARALNSPVHIEGATFVLPSATRPDLRSHHRVTFDSASDPRRFSCTCEAFQFNNPCWAAARALDVLFLLAANGVTLAAEEAETGGGPVSAADDHDGATEDAVKFDGPLPRLECRRVFRVEPEGNAEAVLVAPVVKKGKVERVRGFQI